ncbi:hypothetical protein [Mangrovibacillus cuniculi]|uniref:Uncharacterized protein n=1 Tax=Mangrovibacillus cuniculi TaxID=2593652 RepID=A0A7S8C9A7_9BACI|nr:hypothetical protein [Mangrovibacillus cuniculi]QPC45598.1 hypothetical protein G8O30_00705 [Mangrovibacillus cuniculi]
MSLTIVSKLASQQGRNDEVPNIELAHELAKEEDREAIQDLIQLLSSKEKKIQNDCIKVVYEIGAVKPELICEYAVVFIELLRSRNNRLVWGSMSALATIAEVASETLMLHVDVLKSVMKTGSVITVDKGVLTLAKLAAVKEENNQIIFPFLLQHLETCRPKEIPQHAESTLIAVTEDNKEEFLHVLRLREEYLSPPQLKRVKKVYKTVTSI